MPSLKTRLHVLEQSAPAQQSKVPLNFYAIDQRIAALGLTLSTAETAEVRAMVRVCFNGSRNGNA
jgi:hypothetical protein